MIGFINDHGGFTIIGWYKRGVINDQSIVTRNSVQVGYNSSINNTSEDNRVDNGEMNYHTCSIHPTNGRLLDCNTTLGRGLRDKKCDVSVLNQM